MNILKNDPFTKTVFTDVLPSDRLPLEIRKRPRGYILNTDPSDKPGSHWVAMYLTEDGKGEFWDSYGQAHGFYGQNFTQFLDKHCGTFTWNRRILQSLHRTCVDNIHYSLLYIDVDIFQCQPLQICLRIAKNGMMSLCVIL
jgi:hypothetical protein